MAAAEEYILIGRQRQRVIAGAMVDSLKEAGCDDDTMHSVAAAFTKKIGDFNGQRPGGLISFFNSYFNGRKVT